MSEVISTLCQNSATSVPHLGEILHYSTCFIPVNGEDQSAASLRFYKKYNLVIVACKGSSTWNDWLSNIDLCPSDNYGEVLNFVHDSAQSKLTDFMEFVKKHKLKNLTVITCGHSRGGGIASYLVT